MALFNQRVGELRSPTASLEALQEINTICNDITLSQPALEALFDLPNLASQFNQTNSAPSVAMLEFVTQQKYETLGMEDFSVATEGILSSIGNGIKTAYDWVMKKLAELGNWFRSFFRKKPAEQMQAEVKQAETVVKASAAAIDEKIKEVQTGKPSPSGIPVNMPHQSYKTPQSSGTSGNIPSHAPMMHVVAQVINKPNVTVQELVEVKEIVVNANKVIHDLRGMLPKLIEMAKKAEKLAPRMQELEKLVEETGKNLDKLDRSFPLTRGATRLDGRGLTLIKDCVMQLANLLKVTVIFTSITTKTLKQIKKTDKLEKLDELDEAMSELKRDPSALPKAIDELEANMQGLAALMSDPSMNLSAEKRAKFDALSENNHCILAAVTMANKLHAILNGS